MSVVNIAIRRHEGVIACDELVSGGPETLGTTKVHALPHIRGALAGAGQESTIVAALNWIVFDTPFGADARVWAERLPQVLAEEAAKRERVHETTVFLVAAVDDEVVGWMFESQTGFVAKPLVRETPYVLPAPAEIRRAARAAEEARGGAVDVEAEPRPVERAVPWQRLRRFLVDVMETQYAEQAVPIGGRRFVTTVTPDMIHTTWLDALPPAESAPT